MKQGFIQPAQWAGTFVAFLRNKARILALGGGILLVLFGITTIFTGRSGLQSSFLTAQASASVAFSDSLSSTDQVKGFPESPELLVFSGDTLAAATPPVTVTPKVLGAIVGTLDGDGGAEITHFVVEEGDTVASVAEKFGISTNTILWANNLSKGASLKPGDELTILPVSGALHAVRPNETLSSIAARYKAKSQAIVDINNLDSADDIYAGDLLVIPGGIRPTTSAGIPLANSYFIYPIPGPHRLTQGLHPYNAVDFSNGSCGEPIFAAAGGKVQRTGYSAIGGNFIRILHPNGVVTYYGHLSSIGVNAGIQVSQGEIIGYTGNTGYTIGPTGCHLHFEVRGAANPFIR